MPRLAGCFENNKLRCESSPLGGTPRFAVDLRALQSSTLDRPSTTDADKVRCDPSPDAQGPCLGSGVLIFAFSMYYFRNVSNPFRGIEVDSLIEAKLGLRQNCINSKYSSRNAVLRSSSPAELWYQ
jgi:hypothetical protein